MAVFENSVTASLCEKAPRRVHIPLLYCIWLNMKNTLMTRHMNKEKSSNRRCVEENTGCGPDRERDKDAGEKNTACASSGFGEHAQWENEDPSATRQTYIETNVWQKKTQVDEKEKSRGLIRIQVNLRQMMRNAQWQARLHLYREKTGNCLSGRWVQADVRLMLNNEIIHWYRWM